MTISETLVKTEIPHFGGPGPAPEICAARRLGAAGARFPPGNLGQKQEPEGQLGPAVRLMNSMPCRHGMPLKKFFSKFA